MEETTTNHLKNLKGQIIELQNRLNFAEQDFKKQIEALQSENKQLKEKNLIFQNIQDYSEKAIFSLDTHFCYTSFNETHRLIMQMTYGVNIEIGKCALDYIDNDADRIYSEKNLTRVLRGESFTEESYYGEGHRKRYFEISYHPVKNAEKEITGVVFISSDITEHKKTLEKLEKTTELLERSNSAARISTWEIDQVNQEVSWSRITNEILGIPQDYNPKLGHEYFHFKEGESRESMYAALEKAKSEGEAFDIEVVIINSSNEEVWVRVIGLCELNEEGKCIRTFGTFQDIHQRKMNELAIQKQHNDLVAIEEELRKNLDSLLKTQNILEIQKRALLITEERYRKVIQTQNDFVLLSEPDTTITFANEALIKTLGLPPENIIGLKWINFTIEEEMGDIKNLIQGLNPENNSFIHENRDRRADGSWGWTQWINQGIFNQKGELVQIQSVGRDISQLKIIQEKLLSEQRRFEDIVNSVDGIVWEANIETFAFTYISKKAESLLGYLLEEWYQKDFWVNHIYEEDKEKVLQECVYHAKILQPHESEYRFIAKDQSLFWLRDIVTICRDAQNNIILRGIIIDITANKKAEKDLLIRYEQLNATLEYAPNVAIQWYNSQGEILYWNKSSEQMYGWKAEEVIGKTLQELDIHSASDEEDFLNILENISKSRSPFGPNELKLKKKGGQECHVLTSIFMIPLNENTEGFACMDIDITEQKKAEKEKWELMERFEKISSNVPGFLYQYTTTPEKKGFIPYASHKIKELTGLDSKLIASDSTHFFNLMPKEDQVSFLESIRLSVKNNKNWHHEFRILKENGEIVWLEGNASIQRLEDGSVNWFGYANDISERKKSEKEIQRVNERLTLLEKFINLSTDAIQVSDEDGYMVYINQVASQRLGIDLDNISKYRVIDFEKHFDSGENWEAHVEELKKKEFIIINGLNMNLKTGKILPVEVIVRHALIQGKGYVIAISRDITERIKAQEEMNQLMEITRSQNQRLSEYAYITSHNIRSSVANMLGINELLHEDPSNSEYLEMLNTSVYQLDGTINTMNDLLAIEREAQTLEKKNIPLLEAIQNNLLLIQTLSQKVEIKILVDKEMVVHAIPAYLDSILNNLLTNAIKYRKQDVDAWIEISAFKESKAIVLVVKDNGIGIDLERFGHKLFKMNSRFHTQVEGKGIGLFFTKYQIEAMGGKIEVQSRPNEGTAFKVWFYE